MKCPYCDNEMKKGYIYGDRYKLKWLPEDKKLTLGVFASGGIEVGEGKGLGIQRPKVETHMCSTCNKMVIDMK